MSTQSSRLELHIDVFDQFNQRALALKTLKHQELVSAVLQEFRELEFLGDNPEEYHLIKLDDRVPLNNETELGEQLTSGQKLIFAEQDAPLPDGTNRPSTPVYLRDAADGKVFKLHWLPAIIGRPDPSENDNDQIAVNLEPFKTGLRVSRRQARIVEENGQFYVESLSQNPTSIQDSDGNLATIRRWRLQNGNVIHLDRSGIALKFIRRDPVVAPTNQLTDEAMGGQEPSVKQ